MKKERFRNIYFWFGLVGVIFSAMGIDVKLLTSWEAVGVAFYSLITNPFMLCSVILAITGVFVDPTTKGLTDGE